MSEVKDKDYYDNGEYEDDYDYVVCVFGKDGDVKSDVKGDLMVKMGECEIVLSYDSKTNKIDISSKDIGDIFFKDGLNVDSVGKEDKVWQDIGYNLEGDDEGNIRHVSGNLRGNVCGNLMGNLMGSW